MIKAAHRVAIYLRVSTLDQTTANQERELREVASRMGCEIVKVYRDHGVIGAKGRDERPQFIPVRHDVLLLIYVTPRWPLRPCANSTV